MKLFKKLFFILIISILFINNIYAKEFIDVKSKNIIVYDINDNRILYEDKSNEKVYIASLTKIMSVIVAIENIEDINDKIKLNYKAFEGLIESDAATAGFKIGDEVTYEDLLYGAMLPSGADAVQALAIDISGSISSFVDLMNEKAKELDLKNTHFINPIGLDSNNHYSSVKDIAILLKYALKNKIFKEIFTTKTYTTTNGIKMNSTLVLYGKTLPTKNILGSKTGWTDKAGLCMASISNLDDMSLLLVTANAPYESSRKSAVKDAVDIYEYYSNNFEYINILKEDNLLVSIKTKYGKDEYKDFYSKEGILKLLPKDISIKDLIYKYDGINLITSKIEEDTKLGTLSIYYEDEELAKIDIILDESIPFNIFRYIKENPIISSIFLFILIIILYKLFKFKKRRKIK